MKISLSLLFSYLIVVAASFAQPLPSYCNDAQHRDQLRSIGPLISIGASVSGGLWAQSFPLLVAHQLCLDEESGYASRHTVSGNSQFPFLKKMFTELRPRIVLAIDHLHHSSKNRRFDAATRRYLDEEIAMLTLDCNHPLIDCSPGGPFAFVKKENYRPVVLLGDIYAFYAEDCKIHDVMSDPEIWGGDIGCIEDYDKMNAYLREKARAYPNLVIFSANALYRNLHAGLPFLYDVDGKLASFFAEELFWDGFHPRSDPGARVFANLTIQKLNEMIAAGVLKSDVAIPYLPLDARFINPFTGVVLITDAPLPLKPDSKLKLVAVEGEEFTPTFSASSAAYRQAHGDWAYEGSFEISDKATVARVGSHPLVLQAVGVTTEGAVIITPEQRALLQRVIDDPRNALQAGLVTRAH